MTYENISEYLNNREKYKADVPAGVEFLSAAVVPTDTGLSYDVIGFGAEYENWGIIRGHIRGEAYESKTWEKLDVLLTHEFITERGEKLRIEIVCVDSGGHFTNAIYRECGFRKNRGYTPCIFVNWSGEFFIGKEKPIAARVSPYPLKLYPVQHDAGRRIVYDAFEKEPRPDYSHFPEGLWLGYHENYFKGWLNNEKDPVYLDLRILATAGAYIVNRKKAKETMISLDYLLREVTFPRNPIKEQPFVKFVLGSSDDPLEFDHAELDPYKNESIIYLKHK